MMREPELKHSPLHDALNSAILSFAARLPEGSVFEFDIGKDDVLLERLVIPQSKQRRGAGTTFLKSTISMLDSAGFTARLVADPTDEPGDPSTFDLVRYYARFGFEAIAIDMDGGVMMKRTPRALPHRNAHMTEDEFERLREEIPTLQPLKP